MSSEAYLRLPMVQWSTCLFVWMYWIGLDAVNISATVAYLNKVLGGTAEV